MYYIHKRRVFKKVTLHVMNPEYSWFYSHPKIRFLEILTSVTINQSPRLRATEYFGIHYHDSNKTRSHNS
jgi:hypothetical protein